MKNYTFRYERNGETYLTGGYGNSPEEAMEHERFWWPELPSLDQMELTETEDCDWLTEEEAYGEEKMLREIFADKETAKAKVAACGASDSDKAWMNQIIESEDPQKYMFADTAVREWLIDAWKH